MELEALVRKLRSSLSILNKRDIQMAAAAIGQYAQPFVSPDCESSDCEPSDCEPIQLGDVRLGDVRLGDVRLGDDCAAIPDGDGYLLLAAEGLWPQLVERDPWFAGWCAVMVNVSDIAAMGGEPIAVVDALWSLTVEESAPMWAGMKAAAQAYGVPIVGGHTNCHSPYSGLAVAILGRAKRLITSFDAQPGDALMMVVNMAGEYYGEYPFWNAATMADAGEVRSHMGLLPQLAASGLVNAGKDISMGGVAGTLLMLAEASGCGALLNLDEVPRPAGDKWEKWLTSFPSFGFLLSVPKQQSEAVQAIFQPEGLVCAVVGEMVAGTEIYLQAQGEQQLLWDIANSLTGFGPEASVEED